MLTFIPGKIKTLQSASLLYRRAATEGRYRGRTRADFYNLHQSAHEFRIIDRSEQQDQEIARGDRPTTVAAAGMAGGQGDSAPEVGMGPFNFDDPSLDTNTLLSQLMAEVSSNVDEQGAWSQWWPLMDEVELPVTDPHGMAMLM